MGYYEVYTENGDGSNTYYQKRVKVGDRYKPAGRGGRIWYDLSEARTFARKLGNAMKSDVKIRNVDNGKLYKTGVERTKPKKHKKAVQGHRN